MPVIESEDDPVQANSASRMTVGMVYSSAVLNQYLSLVTLHQTQNRKLYTNAEILTCRTISNKVEISGEKMIIIAVVTANPTNHIGV